MSAKRTCREQDELEGKGVKRKGVPVLQAVRKHRGGRCKSHTNSIFAGAAAVSGR